VAPRAGTPRSRRWAASGEVFFAFAARAQVDAALRTLLHALDDELRALCAWAVRTVGGGRGAVEAERLHALVDDGLAFHTAARPGAMPSARLRRVLARHLDELARGSS
jgi:BetI-type transcriptional repressor, C-terminal